MDKFKIELTWHNCKTHPPKEMFNPWIVYTNGRHVSAFAYYDKYGFPIADDKLHEYWWADIGRTVRESKEFKEIVNE